MTPLTPYLSDASSSWRCWVDWRVHYSAVKNWHQFGSDFTAGRAVKNTSAHCVLPLSRFFSFFLFFFFGRGCCVTNYSALFCQFICNGLKFGGYRTVAECSRGLMVDTSVILLSSNTSFKKLTFFFLDIFLFFVFALKLTIFKVTLLGQL